MIDGRHLKAQKMSFDIYDNLSYICGVVICRRLNIQDCPVDRFPFAEIGQRREVYRAGERDVSREAAE